MKMRENWFLLGDIHGNAAPVAFFYKKNRRRCKFDRTRNYMILLGDVGANYDLGSQRDREFKAALSEYPFTYLCLRGNHEARVLNAIKGNPGDWKSRHKYGGIVYVEQEFPQIEYLSDAPAVYWFAGYKTLCIPGAYSVDKWYRLSRGWIWYADEQLTEEEMELGRQLKQRQQPFDLVLSHTCPIAYEPQDLFLAGVDQSMVDKTMEHYLGELEFDLNYKRWAWGHFHADRLYPLKDGRRMMMLFNRNVVDLRKFMEMQEEDGWREIYV